MYLRVKPKKSTLRLENSLKLAPRYCRPFHILERIGLVSYRLALLTNARVYNFFHVSLLKKYVVDPKHLTT